MTFLGPNEWLRIRLPPLIGVRRVAPPTPFGAEATLLAVLPANANGDATHDQVVRFLAAGARSLAVLGVPARTVIRSGAIPGAILAEMTVAQYDLLVLGAPRPARDGRSVLAGVVDELLRTATNQAILLVRSPKSVACPSLL